MRSSMSTYYFDTQDAIDYGVEKAVILYNLCFWIKHNKANNTHLYEGRYWTYNSATAFAELFPFWSKQKIGRLLRGLEEDGAIVSDSFNKAGFDKTKWYSVLKSACLNSNAPLFKSEQPIPDSKPDNKQHIPMVAGEPAPSMNSSEQVQSKASSAPAKKKKKSSFVADNPPTKETVEAWAIDWATRKLKDVKAVVAIAEKARTTYDNNDWKDACGTKVKCWKSKITNNWLTDDKINEARGIQPQRSYKQGGEADNYV